MDDSQITELLEELPTDRPHVDVTLLIKSDLTFYNAKIFEVAIHNYVERTHRDICLDLSQVQYVDSTGIGLLVRVAQNLENRGALLLVANLQDGVAKVIEMLKLDRILRTV